MKIVQLISIAAISMLLFFSCKKDSFITSPDAQLLLSTDSIKFDTVFTSIGSVTQSFKIFNENNQKLLISKVKLMGGVTSSFKININGVPANEQDDIEIAANDSIYVFVTVTVNPTAANLPFIIGDSILIQYNGNDVQVKLQAYGQNAHFLNNRVISTNTNWTNDLPYVILGGFRVDTAVRLSIDPGCRIFLHASAPFIVDGILEINGTKGNEVQFAGDRLDEPYKNFPAGWPGIYFRGSSNNNYMTYAIIKNAYQAVVVQDPSTNANPKLLMHQCIIDNAYDAGLLGINSSVQSDNTLITNCGKNINIILGGDYTFTNCTIASYSNTFLLHKTPVLVATNFADQGGITLTSDLNAIFRNCIFWGDNGFIEDELSITKQGTNTFNVLLDHCLYKASADPANTSIAASIKNMDPSFDSIDIDHKYYDFRITKFSSAPGIDQGTATGFLKDLDNNNRNVGLPDIGCYEKQ
jgi:hypothetical protein